MKVDKTTLQFCIENKSHFSSFLNVVGSLFYLQKGKGNPVSSRG